MITAYTAWDIQNASQGRLILGLGSQVKAHNERRFAVADTGSRRYFGVVERMYMETVANSLRRPRRDTSYGW
jgi:alkanesulfonate monooxygenase SsuD/methylene tetrahydromethanopterin reductase-like flavin-dependent oxidoreductase (luciferase family)